MPLIDISVQHQTLGTFSKAQCLVPEDEKVIWRWWINYIVTLSKQPRSLCRAVLNPRHTQMQSLNGCSDKCIKLFTRRLSPTKQVALLVLQRRKNMLFGKGQQILLTTMFCYPKCLRTIRFVYSKYVSALLIKCFIFILIVYKFKVRIIKLLL